jgi:SRSO17 transposase
MAKRLALGECDQLHHFIAAGVWKASPVETELLVQADRLVGGRDAVLVIDDTALPKKGTHSVGVAAQYASALVPLVGLNHFTVPRAIVDLLSDDRGYFAVCGRR